MRGILVMVGVASAGLMTKAAASAAPTLTGFDQVAEGEVITIHKPLWQSGKLRVGNATGRVHRDALGRVRTAGFERTSQQQRSRYGRTRFEVSGSDVGGKLSGECGYDRLEQRLSTGGWSVSYPAEPLQMICSFTRNGAPIGKMRVLSRPSLDKLVQVTTREGEVEVSGARLVLRSGHRLGSRGVPTADPVGYWFEGLDGAKVGAVDLNDFTKVRVALPRDPRQRDAALTAGMALAIFWDPGDTDND